MKKIFSIIFAFTCINLYAQVPQGIPYQAAARNASGQPLVNTAVKVRFSIMDSVATGITVYQETHSVTTNNIGLFNVNVGLGTPVTGTFSGISWGQNFKFMKVELDPSGAGSNYVDMGTQQMMSVPYALYSATSGAVQGGASSSSGIHMQVYTAGTYTWVVPQGISSVMVEMWGAGGGGSVGFYTNCGGAGGAGGYGKGPINVIPGEIITFQVGSGGIGCSSNNVLPCNGYDGGNTTFKSLVAYGGTKGIGNLSGLYQSGSPGADGISGTCNALLNCTSPNLNPCNSLLGNQFGKGGFGVCNGSVSPPYISGNGSDGYLILTW